MKPFTPERLHEFGRMLHPDHSRADACAVANSLEHTIGNPFSADNRDLETTHLILRGWDSAQWEAKRS